MRKLWRVSGVVAVLAVSALTSAAAPARSAAPGASGFWAVTVPGESFTDSAVQAAGAPGSHVAATIRGMIRAVEAGKTVLVPEGTGQGVHLVPASVSGLQAAHAAVGLASSRPGTGGAGELSRLSRAVDPTDPHTFPILGNGCHPVTWRGTRYWASWCKMPFQIDGEFCDVNGCTITDVLKTRLLVDPGTRTSRVSRTSTYRYQAGHRRFIEIHIEWWTLCFKNELECGTNNTAKFLGNSSSTFTVSSTRDLHNSRIRHGFTLWAFFTPIGMWRPSSAKTWKGICKPRSSGSNQCLYPA
jgi:hypothetical protein